MRHADWREAAPPRLADFLQEGKPFLRRIELVHREYSDGAQTGSGGLRYLS